MFNQCLDTFIMINYDNFQGNITKIMNITPDFESDHKFNFYPNFIEMNKTYHNKTEGKIILTEN